MVKVACSSASFPRLSMARTRNVAAPSGAVLKGSGSAGLTSVPLNKYVVLVIGESSVMVTDGMTVCVFTYVAPCTGTSIVMMGALLSEATMWKETVLVAELPALSVAATSTVEVPSGVPLNGRGSPGITSAPLKRYVAEAIGEASAMFTLRLTVSVSRYVAS